MPMELKTVEVDGKTYAEVSDGKPVFTEDGKDIAFDAVHATAEVKSLRFEAMGHRTAKETAEAALKPFGGVDAKAAIKALGIVKNLDDKKLVDAGEVETIKAEAAKAYEIKLSEKDSEITGLKGDINREIIGGEFSRSKLIDESVAAPRSLVQSFFQGNFSYTDGKISAKDAAGNTIYSKERPGEPAGFDEALESLIDASPDRDHILKGQGKGGGGKPPDAGGGKPRTISTADFNALDPKSRAKAMEEGVTLQ